MKKKIAVIGSGIAGLTIANLFKEKSNFEVMVYEKEKILSLDEGYGVQLAPNTISIFDLLATCLSLASPPYSLPIGLIGA